MVIPVAAAGIAARRAALSAARKTKKRARKSAMERGKRVASAIGGFDEDAGKRISWIEILFVVVFLALPNDLLDVINLTGVGKIITIFVEPITLFFIFIWFWFRVRERTHKKVAKNALTFIAEIIPIVGLFPIWTLLVINVKTGWFNWLFKLPEKLFDL